MAKFLTKEGLAEGIPLTTHDEEMYSKFAKGLDSLKSAYLTTAEKEAILAYVFGTFVLTERFPVSDIVVITENTEQGDDDITI